MKDCKRVICGTGDKIRLGNHTGIIQPWDDFLGIYVKLDNGKMRYLQDGKFEIIKKAKR